MSRITAVAGRALLTSVERLSRLRDRAPNAEHLRRATPLRG
jgi:hypothetical protein